MHYFLLRQDRNSALWDALFVDGASLQALRVGLPMTVPANPARVSLSPVGRGPSDYLELPCPVVSHAMRHALDEAGVDNVQYVPAEMDFAYTEGQALGTCWLANVVGAVACARPLSAAEVREREARGVAAGPSPGFAIDLARAHDFPLFRLAENRDLIVASSDVVTALRDAGLRGLVIQAPEDYNGLSVSSAPPDGDAGAATASHG